MPLDAARWQIDILAADKTAQAFQSVDRRMKGLSSSQQSAATQMSATFGKLKNLLATFGVGLSAGGALNLVKQIGDIGDEADKVQLATDSFQALTSALGDAGIAAEQSSSLISRGSQTIGKAFEGNKEAIELLRRLGVGLIDLRGNTATFEETMPRVARAILDIENPMQRSAAAAAFFGGQVGKQAIPALEAMARGTEALKEQYRAEIIPAETIRRFDTFSDRLTSLGKQALVQFADQVNRAFSPDVVSAIDRATGAWKAFFAEVAGVNTGPFGDISKLLKSTAREIEMIGDVAERAARALRGLRFENGTGFTIEVAAPRPTPPPDKRGSQYGPGTMPAPPDPFKNLPGIKGEAEKLDQRLREMQNERRALETALKAFETKLGTETVDEVDKRLDAQVKLQKKIYDVLKDVPPNSPLAAQLTQEATAISQLTTQLDERKRLLTEAEQTTRQYGDGSLEAARATEQLNRMLALGAIDAETHARALRAVTQAQEDQARAARGARGGADGFIAGIEQRMAEYERANTAFAAGGQLFDQTMSLMDQALTEFVDKGTVNFNRLLASFVSMLAQMAIRAAASSIFNMFLGGGGGSYGYGPGLPGGSMSYGGPRASGGPVSGGRIYTVGEHGPELFLSRSGGRIVPNDQLGGGSNVTVNVINNAEGTRARTQEQRGQDGSRTINVIVEQVEAMMAGRVQRNQGALAGAMQGTYGLTPVGRR